MKLIKLLALSTSCILFIVLLNEYNISSDTWIGLIFAAFIGLGLLIFDQLDYYLVQLFRMSSWVNPIIKLSIILIKLDGVEKVSETKRIIKYLNEEFEPNMAKIKLKFYKKQLKFEQSLIEVCNQIRESNTSSDKVRVMQHLIRLALSDNSSSKRAFSILGLEPNSSMEEVKDAHRELVKIYHPDKLKKNERNKEQAKIKFQAITDAYQFLKNELN